MDGDSSVVKINHALKAGHLCGFHIQDSRRPLYDTFAVQKVGDSNRSRYDDYDDVCNPN